MRKTSIFGPNLRQFWLTWAIFGFLPKKGNRQLFRLQRLGLVQQARDAGPLYLSQIFFNFWFWRRFRGDGDKKFSKQFLKDICRRHTWFLRSQTTSPKIANCNEWILIKCEKPAFLVMLAQNGQFFFLPKWAKRDFSTGASTDRRDS